MKRILVTVKEFLFEELLCIVATVFLILAHYEAKMLGFYWPFTANDELIAIFIAMLALVYMAAKSSAETSRNPRWKQVWIIVCVALSTSYLFGMHADEYIYDDYGNETRKLTREEVARIYYIPLLAILIPALIGNAHGVKNKRKLEKQLSESLDIGERLRELSNLTYIATVGRTRRLDDYFYFKINEKAVGYYCAACYVHTGHLRKLIDHADTLECPSCHSVFLKPNSACATPHSCGQ